MQIKRTTADGASAATPNVRREMQRTGRLPGDGVGDTPQPASVPPAKPQTETTGKKDEGVPKNVNKELWAQAESNALNGGGFAGMDEKAKTALIREQYDQMVENDKKTKAWAGDGGILGDI